VAGGGFRTDRRRYRTPSRAKTYPGILANALAGNRRDRKIWLALLYPAAYAVSQVVTWTGWAALGCSSSDLTPAFSSTLPPSSTYDMTWRQTCEQAGSSALKCACFCSATAATTLFLHRYQRTGRAYTISGRHYTGDNCASADALLRPHFVLCTLLRTLRGMTTPAQHSDGTVPYRRTCGSHRRGTLLRAGSNTTGTAGRIGRLLWALAMGLAGHYLTKITKDHACEPQTADSSYKLRSRQHFR